MKLVEFDSADDVWDYLQPSADHWFEQPAAQSVFSESPEGRWVFRGHADHSWALLPSAWRDIDDPSKSKIRAIADSFERPNFISASSNKNRRLYERLYTAQNKLLMDFVLSAENAGFDTRTTGSVLRQAEANLPIVKPNTRYGEVGEVALGIAQHVGVPTYLLDWTRDPRVALYFALGERGLHEKNDVDATLFAFRRTANDPTYLGAASVANPYIRHQKGVLMVMSVRDDFFDIHGRYPTFDEIQEKWYPDINGRSSLLKIVIKATWKDTLNRKLARSGINRVTIMPSLESVAALVMERAS